MSEPVPHRLENKEAKKYTFGDIADIVYWSFEVSQGMPMQQRATYMVLLERNPALLAKVGEWRDHLVERDDLRGTKWKEDTTLCMLVDRVQKKRGSKTHTSPEKAGGEELAARQVADQISSLFGVYKQLTTKERPGGDSMWVFLLGVADRDIVLSTANMFSDKPGMPEARARVGGSRLCWYALSEKREKHLAGTAQSPVIKDLWREMGEYVRTTYPTMGPQLKEKIDKVVELYRQQTGEEIKLG